MSYSHGEVASLVFKAARGAGLEWGMAEELRWAVRWLNVRCLTGAEAAAGLLEDTEGMSALELGVQIADAAAIGDVPAGQAIRAPMLLVPFLARCLADGQRLEVDVVGTSFAIGAYGTDLSTRLARSASVSLGPLGRGAVGGGCRDRVPAIEPTALAALERLAMRTYAPATEASRQLGAGAGTSDND